MDNAKSNTVIITLDLPIISPLRTKNVFEFVNEIAFFIAAALSQPCDWYTSPDGSIKQLIPVLALRATHVLVSMARNLA